MKKHIRLLLLLSVLGTKNNLYSMLIDLSTHPAHDEKTETHDQKIGAINSALNELMRTLAPAHSYRERGPVTQELIGGHLARIQHVITHYPAQINTLNEIGQTSLGHFIEILRVNYNDMTPEVRHKFTETIVLFIRHGADIKLCKKQIAGITPTSALDEALLLDSYNNNTQTKEYKPLAPYIQELACKHKKLSPDDAGKAINDCWPKQRKKKLLGRKSSRVPEDK